VAGPPPRQGTHTLSPQAPNPALSVAYGMCYPRDQRNNLIDHYRVDSWPYQDTTGALLLARSRLQARQFQIQFKERKIKKTYLALVQAEGDAFPGTSGTIRNAFAYGTDGRFSKLAFVRSDLENGKVVGESDSLGAPTIHGKTMEAVTHWKLLGSSVRSSTLPISPHKLGLRQNSFSFFFFLDPQTRAPISLVSLGLETGAKHQLRIHLSKVLNGEGTSSSPLPPPSLPQSYV
jgi:hypothetical protein